MLMTAVIFIASCERILCRLQYVVLLKTVNDVTRCCYLYVSGCFVKKSSCMLHKDCNSNKIMVVTFTANC